MIKNNLIKFLRYCKVLCTEYLTDTGIYCAAILIFAVCLIGPSAELGDKSYSIPVLIFHRDLYRQALNDFGCCAQLVAKRFDSHTLFTILLPVIVSFPALKIFVQHEGSVQKPVLIRTNKRSYRAGLFLSAFLSGFVIAFIGIMLYLIIVFVYFPTIGSYNNAEFIEIYGGVAAQTINLIKKLANVCIVSGTFPIITMIIYAATRDKFLSLTLPMMIQYVSMKINIIYSSWLYSDMERSTNFYFNFIGMMLPFNLTSHYSAWEHRLKLSFACFFAFAAIIITILYIIFSKLMERSIGGEI